MSQDKCPYCESPKSKIFDCFDCGSSIDEEYQTALCEERAALAETRKDRDALQVQLRAWQTAFGTTQPTHALAKLEAAEKAVKRSRTDLENAKADAESWHAQQDRFAAELIETSKQLERSRAKWARLREWASKYSHRMIAKWEIDRLDAEEKEGK